MYFTAIDYYFFFFFATISFWAIFETYSDLDFRSQKKISRSTVSQSRNKNIYHHHFPSLSFS